MSIHGVKVLLLFINVFMNHMAIATQQVVIRGVGRIIS